MQSGISLPLCSIDSKLTTLYHQVKDPAFAGFYTCNAILFLYVLQAYGNVKSDS
jgi:hypothetical protein